LDGLVERLVHREDEAYSSPVSETDVVEGSDSEHLSFNSIIVAGAGLKRN